MTTKCIKCWQPWDGWGCVCNDCKRSEQLAEQNRLVAEQIKQAADNARRQEPASSFFSANIDDLRPPRALTPEELEKERLDYEEAFRIYTKKYSVNKYDIIITLLVICLFLFISFF